LYNVLSGTGGSSPESEKITLMMLLGDLFGLEGLLEYTFIHKIGGRRVLPTRLYWVAFWGMWNPVFLKLDPF